MSVETVDVGVSDKELFSGALSDEPIADAAPVAEPEPQPERVERVRDEQGRYAKAEPAPAPVETPQPSSAVNEQPKPETDAQVPSWRLREIREAREAAERRAQEAEQRAIRMEAQLRQLSTQQQQQTPPPDMFANPNEWQAHLAQQFQTQADKVRFDLSEDAARDKYGDEKVNAALRWAETNLGHAERVKIQNARSPYREMVQLYEERQTLQQIGGNLESYKAKVREEALNDPAFMQMVADKLRGQAPQTNGRPAVQLPPSLNRASGQGTSSDALTDADMSDRSLFKHAYGS